GGRRALGQGPRRVDGRLPAGDEPRRRRAVRARLRAARGRPGRPAHEASAPDRRGAQRAPGPQRGAPVGTAGADGLARRGRGERAGPRAGADPRPPRGDRRLPASRQRSRAMSERIRALQMNDGNRRWWALGAMCFALFMIMLDNTVVNVALPSIQRGLHASTASLEWTVNAYTLSFAVLLVTGGRLGDLFGRRTVFLAGVAIFAGSSGAIGFSPDDTWLVAWRAAQGVGAALMMPATLSIITNAFPAAERGKAIGTWAGVSALALAIGPVLGGFLVQSVSWQSIFFLNVPVAAAAILVTLFAVRESRDETVERTVDVPGVVTLTIGLAALVLALVEGNSWHWSSGRELALYGIALAGLASFAAVERRRRVPMVDFSFFRSRTFFGANIVAFIVSF